MKYWTSALLLVSQHYFTLETQVDSGQAEPNSASRLRKKVATNFWVFILASISKKMPAVDNCLTHFQSFFSFSFFLEPTNHTLLISLASSEGLLNLANYSSNEENVGPRIPSPPDHLRLPSTPAITGRWFLPSTSSADHSHRSWSIWLRSPTGAFHFLVFLISTIYVRTRAYYWPCSIML